MQEGVPSAPEFLTWYGHDCFKIVAGGKIIYLDPFQLTPPKEPADLILVTHEHFDHCSKKDIDLVAKPTTSFIASTACAGTLSGVRLETIVPGQRLERDGVTVEAVPAYNIGKTFHPVGTDRVGYIITVEGQRIYHAGDTDNIPALRGLQGIDLALVPVSGTYVMTAEEAADAVNAFRPKLAIPMHYGSIIGNADDAGRFRSLAKVPVAIMTAAS